MIAYFIAGKVFTAVQKAKQAQRRELPDQTAVLLLRPAGI
jgi:hypothetical protein